MAEFPKDVKSSRLVMSLGATLEIDGIAWVKPYVSQDVVFEGFPTNKAVDEAWSWLQDKIEKQADDLIRLIKEEIEIRPSTEPPMMRPPVEEAPPGSAY